MKNKRVMKRCNKGVALALACILFSGSLTVSAREAIALEEETLMETEIIVETEDIDTAVQEEVLERETGEIIVESETEIEKILLEELEEEESSSQMAVSHLEDFVEEEGRILKEPFLNLNFSGLEAFPKSENAEVSIFQTNTQMNSVTSLSIEGIEKYSYSWKVLELINQERAGAGLDTYLMDEDLLEVAMLRAQELTFSYSYFRPDGTLCWTAEQITPIAEENIALWYETPEQVMYIWNNAPSKHTDILSTAYKSVGVGCFEMNGAMYWVLLFSREESSTSAIRKGDQAVTAVIQALTNTIHAKIELRNVNVKEGHKITSDFTVFRTNSDQGVPIKLKEVDWGSSNTGVAVIENNGTIKGVKSGLTTITGTLKSNPAIFATTTVSVLPLTHTEQFVARCYTYILEREFDESGLAYWSNQLMTGGLTAADVAQQILFSPEFIAKKVPDSSYLTILYQVFLNRMPDANGFSYWMHYLTQGVSRRGVLSRFIASPEFAVLSKQYGLSQGSVTISEPRDRNMDITAYVSRCYTQILSRKADAEGLNYWCNQILNKRITANQLTQVFLQSPEFQGKQVSNQVYIATLYRTYMGREGDVAGMQYWLMQLNQGISRQAVAERFGTSPEFKLILKSYGL